MPYCKSCQKSDNSLDRLEHAQLPAYYRAQAYIWLSSCEGYDRLEHAQEAAYWIVKARDEK